MQSLQTIQALEARTEFVHSLKQRSPVLWPGSVVFIGESQQPHGDISGHEIRPLNV